MRRLALHVAGMAGVAFVLSACGFADVRAPVPEFMRAKAPEPAPAEPAPDIRRLLRDNIESVFTAASRPTNVQTSLPRHAPTGSNWTACVRADLTSVTGKPLGPQTYKVTITEGRIVDRRRAEDDDNCSSESYAAL